ncbi:MAG: hypothetical protein OXM88_09255 [bacterium]|nr:hypothetical protein [bacterium]
MSSIEEDYRRTIDQAIERLTPEGIRTFLRWMRQQAAKDGVPVEVVNEITRDVHDRLSLR